MIFGISRNFVLALYINCIHTHLPDMHEKSKYNFQTHFS